MDKEHIFLMMEPNIKENLKIIYMTVMEFVPIQTDIDIRVNGKMNKYKEKDNIS